jgi:hypothetical protein
MDYTDIQGWYHLLDISVINMVHTLIDNALKNESEMK